LPAESVSIFMGRSLRELEGPKLIDVKDDAILKTIPKKALKIQVMQVGELGGVRVERV